MADTTVVLARSLGLSPESRMQSGYGGASRRLDAMDAVWNWQVLHPEMKRRHLAIYFSDPRTVRVGIDADGLAILVTPLGSGSSGRGTGPAAVANFWSRNSRTYLAGRPSRSTPEGRAWLLPGKAPIAYPGGSNHEDDTFEGRAMAVDNVGWNTDPWFNNNVERFGLRDFTHIGSEPWHTQPCGYGASKSALQRDLAKWGLAVIDLPAIPLATPPAPEPPPAPLPPDPIDPTEDDDMRELTYIWKHKNRHTNKMIGTFLCAPAGTSHLSGESLALLRSLDPPIPEIEEADDNKWRSCMESSRNGVPFTDEDGKVIAP